MKAVCCDCGRPFERDAEWKARCFPCWLRTKKRDDASPDANRRGAREALEGELAENLATLIVLCHPDRHGGSTASNRITAWLLGLRRRLPRMERAA